MSAPTGVPVPAPLPAGLEALVPGYLVKQRWYAGPSELDVSQLSVVDGRELCATGEGARHLYLAIVEVAGVRYQLLIGERPAGEQADFLSGHGDAVLGGLEGSYLYDATLDPELMRELLPIVSGGVEAATRVRPISAEQSNTSLVYDDRIILKVFRRLLDGHNPDVEVTNALARVGFTHVAQPVGTWREAGVDLAFAQEFLTGGSEGWALALTSLRDFYQGDGDEPSAAGGDFSMEAMRLGRVTAQLHLAMGQVYDVEPLGAEGWSGLIDAVAARLAEGPPADDPGGEAAVARPEPEGELLDRLRAVTDPGPALRVHGDYHLGQVMRADGGWYVLDFEGEPARPLAERTRPASPYKDVAGMLRSFDYAARFALVERGGAAGDVSAAADAWAAHNRSAFLDGYLGEAGIDELLPTSDSRDLVLAAYELDKALYELSYERAYRPSWVPIPATAITRIMERLTG
jgi:maltokinase